MYETHILSSTTFVPSVNWGKVRFLDIFWLGLASNTFGLFCLNSVLSMNWKPVQISPFLCNVHLYGFQILLAFSVWIVCKYELEACKNFPLLVQRARYTAFKSVEMFQ
jgi:hypothetical protein